MIKVSQRELKDAIAFCWGGIKRKPAMPILANFLFNIRGSKAYITSNNLENSFKTHIDVVSDNDYDFCVNADDLRKIVSALRGDIELHANFVNHTLDIVSGSSKYSIYLESADDFPNIELNNEKLFEQTLDGNEFIHMVSVTSKVLAHDDLRPVLSCVNIDFLKDKVVFVGTDAHKMVISHIDNVNNAKEHNILLNASTAAYLSSFKNDNVKVTDYSNIILIEGQDKQIFQTKAEGSFPNYNSIVPKESNINVEVDVSKLKECTSRLLNVSNPLSNVIVFNVNGNFITLESSDVEFNKSGVEKLECRSDGDIRVGINGVYLNTLLSNINKEKMTFKFIDDKSIIYICSHNNIHSYLMPVFIQ